MNGTTVSMGILAAIIGLMIGVGGPQDDTTARMDELERGNTTALPPELENHDETAQGKGIDDQQAEPADLEPDFEVTPEFVPLLPVPPPLEWESPEALMNDPNGGGGASGQLGLAGEADEGAEGRTRQPGGESEGVAGRLQRASQ